MQVDMHCVQKRKKIQNHRLSLLSSSGPGWCIMPLNDIDFYAQSPTVKRGHQTGPLLIQADGGSSPLPLL